MADRPSALSSHEQGAREAIFARVADRAEGDDFDLREATAIASSFAVTAPEEFAESQVREALLIYLGAGWGVGPKARWRDRLRSWWACRS